MECKETREKISSYIDGQLFGPDKKQFEDHLAVCAECRQLLEETRQAVSVVQRAEAVPLPVDFMVRLNERLDKEAVRQENRKNIFNLFPWRTVAAVLSLVLVVIIAKETTQPPAVIMQKVLQEKDTVSLTEKADNATIASDEITGNRTKGRIKDISSEKKNSAPRPELVVSAPEQDTAEKQESVPAGAGVQPEREESPLYDQARNYGKMDSFISKAKASDFAATPQGRASSMESFVAPREGIRPRSLNSVNQWKGSVSGITNRLQTVVMHREEWRSLWKRHESSPVPDVDFSRYMVVALFGGEKRSGGYSITIARIEKTADGITVWYSEGYPSGDAMTASVLTQPYHISVVDRAEGPVRFQREL